MTEYARCQFILPHVSGLVRDNVVWDFYFATNVSFDSTVMAAIQTSIEDFYTAIITGPSHQVGNYIGRSISRTIHPVLKSYNVTGHLNGSAAGSPFDTRDLALMPTVTGTGVDLPAEVAGCLSYHTSYGSDPEFAPGTRPRARDRGRIFIGPLTSLAMQNATTSLGPQFTQNFIDTLTGATAPLMALVNPIWQQWSRAAARMSDVTGGWVDNAPDTQRRRGERPTARTMF